MHNQPYSQTVSRAQKGCIVFLLDQSFSMLDPLGGEAIPKCDKLEVAINRFLSELIMRCEKGDDEPRDYFDVAVIGYTTDKSGHPVIKPAFGGELADKELVSIPELYQNPLDIEFHQYDDGAGGLAEKTIPVWYRAAAIAGTPMCAALRYCKPILEQWCFLHPQSFPPIVIHITDGESTDGDPDGDAEALRNLSTSDGNVLLFNCHLSMADAKGVLFPTSADSMPDPFAKLLFRMSSPLPERLLAMAESSKIKVEKGARGMAFQADGTSMLMLINVGTIVSTQTAETVTDPSNLR